MTEKFSLQKRKPQKLYSPSIIPPPAVASFRDTKMRRISHMSITLSSKIPLACQDIVGQTVVFPRDVGQLKIPYLLGSYDAIPPLAALALQSCADIKMQRFPYSCSSCLWISICCSHNILPLSRSSARW